MEKETTQANEGLEAVIADMKKQVENLTKDEKESSYWEIEYDVSITVTDAIKLIEFYNKHSKPSCCKKCTGSKQE